MIDAALTIAVAGTLTAVVATAAALVALRSLRAARAATATSRTHHLELCEGFSQLAGANATLRRQLEQLAERVDRVGQVPATSAPAASLRAYELAARLAASGAVAAELVASCGLTPAEADLAVLVHGSRPRAACTH